MRSDGKGTYIYSPRDAQQDWPCSTTTTSKGVGREVKGGHTERRTDGSEFQITRSV